MNMSSALTALRQKIAELQNETNDWIGSAENPRGTVKRAWNVPKIVMLQGEILALAKVMGLEIDESRLSALGTFSAGEYFDHHRERFRYMDSILAQANVLVDVRGKQSPVAGAGVSQERHKQSVRAIAPAAIGVIDNELRERCLDLLSQFQADGQTARLDTVVTEATRILENRLRSLCGADASVVGTKLSAFAFTGRVPRLKVSDLVDEQNAAHLLFSGVFGLVRNSVHHKLVGNLVPERVLQIIGMVDYLISVAEAAQKASSTATP